MIDLPVVLCPDKVERAVIAERAPLGVDQDVLFVRVLVAVEHFAVLDLLDVARVAAGAFLVEENSISFSERILDFEKEKKGRMDSCGRDIWVH